MSVDKPEDDDLPRLNDAMRDVGGRPERVAVEDRDRSEYYDALRAAVDEASSHDGWEAVAEQFRESWAEHCERWPRESREQPDRSADPPGSWRGDSGRYLDSDANAEVEERCGQVGEIERKVISPAMLEIEARDPDRHLAGFDHRLKGPDRLKDKIAADIDEKGRTVSEAITMIKDIVRYTFVYRDDHYAAGVDADIARMEAGGFRQAERRNTWEDEQYKGINSRWREPNSGQLFEVQFHTEASYEAKQFTHCAYERSRDPITGRGELRELRHLQGDVFRQVPIPQGAAEIPHYP
jgi:hypothetical protein